MLEVVLTTSTLLAEAVTKNTGWLSENAISKCLCGHQNLHFCLSKHLHILKSIFTSYMSVEKTGGFQRKFYAYLTVKNMYRRNDNEQV